MLAVSTTLDFACGADGSGSHCKVVLENVSLLDGGHRWLLAKVAADLFQHKRCSCECVIWVKAHITGALFGQTWCS